MIKVLLVDDQVMFLDALQQYFHKNTKINIVGTAINGLEAISFLDKKEVDVVVLDLLMPKLNGIKTAKHIKKYYPDVKILILSAYKDKLSILELMKIGINGYMLKTRKVHELLHAIISIYKGDTYFGLEVLNAIASTNPEHIEKITLTSREEEILKLIGQGFTSHEIATKLRIAYNTVTSHRSNLLQKLDLPNDKHLVRYAIKHGYVEL